MKLAKLLPLLLLIPIGCTTPSTADGSNDPCGEGDLTIGVCVYRGEVVVENGFTCPQTLPELTILGGFGVCSEGPVDGERVEEIFAEHQRAHPGAYDGGRCALASQCDSASCVAGACEECVGDGCGVCASDGDCGTGQVCVAGACVGSCVEPEKVKVLVLMDASASAQCTDPNGLRFQEIADAAEVFAAAGVEVGFIEFSAWARESPFSIDPVLPSASSGLGPASDLQGALTAAINVVEQDLAVTSADDLEATAYSVVILSDGGLDPICQAGCEDDQAACTDGLDNDGDGLIDAEDPNCVGDCSDPDDCPDTLYGVCNYTGDIDPDTYIDFAGNCGAYNTAGQLEGKVSSLLDLAESYGSSLTVHVRQIREPDEVVEGFCPGFESGFGEVASWATYEALSAQGRGTARQVEPGEQGYLTDILPTCP